MKSIKLALVGAGSRGLESYAPHIKNSKYNVEFVALAEPRDLYRKTAIESLNIPLENAYKSWEDLIKVPKLADGVIIATQDNMHAKPAQAFMDLGYHVLLEKPMATNEQDCRDIIKSRQKTNRILAICHVMRYANKNKLIKEILLDGKIGDITNIQHIEPIGYWHFAHSYVRGNWNNEFESSPMLLAKSCHDLDIIRYWIGKQCLRVSSFGNLKFFTKANMPEGATERCVDCPKDIERKCPYSAIKIYLGKFKGSSNWPNNVLSIDTSESSILQALKMGEYGRCVFNCDNDVVDHQVVNMEFEDNIYASFTVSAFTKAQDRETWIMGSNGQLRSTNDSIEVHSFLDDSTQLIKLNDPDGNPIDANGHSGDSEIVLSFIEAIAENNPKCLPSTPEESLESHLIAFYAEKARENNTIETIKLH